MTTETDSSGQFILEENDPLSDYHVFSLTSEDEFGAESLVSSFALDMDPDTGYVISDHLLSPTLNVSQPSAARDEEATFYGMSVPGEEVEVRFWSDGEERVTLAADVDDDGNWELVPDFEDLEEELEDGRYNVRARAKAHREESAFSEKVVFSLGETGCALADITGDGNVALPDFSILMYNWGTDSQEADLNRDGVVDLIDFSIMMDCWTG